MSNDPGAVSFALQAGSFLHSPRCMTIFSKRVASAAGAAGAAGAQGDQGKQGPAGDPAPCVQCQDVIDASFDLACQLFALVPPKTVDQFQDVADAAVAIAIVNANVCPDSHSGFAGCAEMVADQVQAVYDDKF